MKMNIRFDSDRKVSSNYNVTHILRIHIKFDLQCATFQRDFTINFFFSPESISQFEYPNMETRLNRRPTQCSTEIL